MCGAGHFYMGKLTLYARSRTARTCPAGSNLSWLDAAKLATDSVA
jgi:hypothetical protein